MKNEQATSRAVLRHVRMAPRKIRYVADLIRGKGVEEALNVLEFTTKYATRPLQKLLKSAVANADQTGHADLDALYVKEITVDMGPKLKRYLPRAMGRATRVDKYTSHVRIVLGEK